MTFIVSPRRTGSTLLMSLLDGHPDLSVWPGEFLYYLALETRHSTFFPKFTFNMEEMLDKLYEPLTYAFRIYQSDLNDEKIDWKEYVRFCHRLMQEIEPDMVMTRLEFLHWLFDRLDDFRLRPHKAKRLVKCMEQGFDWLDSELTHCKLICTYRDPKRIYLGWRKRWRREGHKLFDFYTKRYHEIMAEFMNTRDLWRNQRLRPTLFVDCDELRQSTKTVMERVCAFLEIPWCDSCLEMTVDEKKFPGFHLESKRNTGTINSRDYSLWSLTYPERKQIERYGWFADVQKLNA